MYNLKTNTGLYEEAEERKSRGTNIQMHTRETRLHSTQSHTETGKTFMAFASMVGIAVIGMAIMLSIFVAIGYVYTFISPIFEACIDWFFKNSIGILVGIGVTAVSLYILDFALEHIKRNKK